MDSALGEFDPCDLEVFHLRRHAGWILWDYWVMVADYGGMVPTLTPPSLTQDEASRIVQF